MVKFGPDLLARYGIPPSGALSCLDDLTGLPNRRFLRMMISKFITDDDPFSILFLDLDNFKQVNDSHGHEEGDRLLQTLGGLLLSSLRTVDRIARYGGDEFIILVPGADDSTAVSISERVISLVKRELKPRWNVTASVGISSFPVNADNASDLLIMADRSMYSAKTSGKSCWRKSSNLSRALYWHENIFSGRDRELSDVLSAVRNRNLNSMTLITGESGSGKTSLLNACAAELESGRIIRIECRPELESIEWAPLVSAIRSCYREFPWPELPEVWGNLLGRIMPDIFGESTLTSSSIDNLAILDAFSTLMKEWTPLVILVDNSQWLDSRTAGFLSYASRVGIDTGFHVCITLIPGTCEIDGNEPAHIHNLPFTGKINLKPLSLIQTVELVRCRLGITEGAEDVAGAVHRYSGGNPLFACEYLRSIFTAGLLDLSKSKSRSAGFIYPKAASDRIRQIVSNKLKLLDPGTRLLLQHASVFMDVKLDIVALRELSGVPEGEMLNSLDICVRQGILSTDAEDLMSFSFTNEGYKQEIYRTASRSLIQDSHSRLGDSSRRKKDYLISGYHLQQCGRFLEALNSFREGARIYLQSGLPSSAAYCLEKADIILQKIPRGDLPLKEVFQLENELAQTYRNTGQWLKVREVSIRAAEIGFNAGMNDQAMGLKLLGADCLRMLNRFEEAISELTDLENQTHGEAKLNYMFRLVDNLCRLGRFEEAELSLNKAEELMDSLGDLNLQYTFDLTHQRLVYLMAREDLNEGLKVAGELLQTISENSSSTWWYYYDIAELYLIAGRPRQSVSNFRKSIRIAMRGAALHGKLVSMAEMAEALFHALDLITAEEILREAGELARRFNETSILIDTGLIGAELLMETGHLELARKNIDDLLLQDPDNLSIAYVNSLLLEREEKLEEAAEEIARVIHLTGGRSMTIAMELSVLQTMDEITLQKMWMDELLGCSTDWDSRISQIIPKMCDRAAFRASGLLAQWLFRHGNPEEADRIMTEALAKPQWMEMKMYRHRNLLIRSEWHPESRDRARELLISSDSSGSV